VSRPTPPEARELDPGDEGVRRAWADTVAAAEGPSPFAALDYAEAAGAAFGLRPRALGVERDGALVAGIVAYEKRRGPYRLAVVPPLTPVTPFVLAEPPSEAEAHARRSPLDALVAGLAERFDALAFQVQPSLADARPFTWAGWTAAPRYTYAAPLGPPEAFLERAGKGVRKRVRREADAFAFAEEPGALGVLQALEGEAYARQGIAPPVAPDRQGALLRPLLASGRARLFVLRDAGGAPVAAQAVVTDGREASFVCGASRPGSAMTVMTYRACARLWEDGAERVDMAGANLPSVAEFKRGFGMPLVQQFRVRYVGRVGLRALALVRPVV
jgi:hypothetical protein